MAHLGLVPRKSIISGGLRAFGKTYDEALILLKNFKNMENAGAFSVEAEVIAEKILEFISQNCNLITISLGSGNYADVNYLFMEDICGENRNLPRHAFSFAKIYKLQDKIYNEKLKAVKKYRKIAKTNKFAPQDKIAQINSKNLEIFKKKAVYILNKK
jgi:3-methyl-2-oxobutanoate hydroxymethyltransferase